MLQLSLGKPLAAVASSRCFALAQLARDGNTEPDLGSGGIRCTIGIMVDAPGEVDQLAGQMRNPDARVTKEPIDAEFFTGRSAYLCDPEGICYEITWPSQITRSHHAAPPEPDRHLARRAFPEASLPTIRLPALLFCAESVEVTPATMR